MENGSWEKTFFFQWLFPTAQPLPLTLGLCPDLSCRIHVEEEAWQSVHSLPSRKQIWDSGSLLISCPMKNSEPKSSGGTKPPYFRNPTS